MKADQKYIVVGSKDWNLSLFAAQDFDQRQWLFIAAKEELTPEKVEAINPRYLFFLHWSWKVPEEIINHYECVCFHMTDVPYGRGGSPLQNLIMRGHQFTKLTALRMTHEFDAGPVYLKQDVGLGGNAEEIYMRITRLSFAMIEQIIREQPQPQPQTGEAVVFKRRQPADSELSQVNSLEQMHDKIRMLDAEGYPPAFIEYEGFRFEFSRSALYGERVVADVIITPIEGAES
ncbi:MAG: methionyl-tRNA formyltransferase [Cyanobacteria bacterium P01_F01_bin.56]